MKTLCAGLLLAVLATVTLAATIYKFEGVRRLDRDLYRSFDKFYIQTQYCYEYTTYSDVIYDDIKRVAYFESGGRCDVVRIFK